MKVQGLFKLSGRTYRARPMRTFLTVFGMSIGIGAVLLLVSLGYGLQQAMLEKITTEDTIYALTLTAPEEMSETLLSRDAFEKIRDRQGVSNAGSSRFLEGRAVYQDLSSSLKVVVIDGAYQRLSGASLVAGEPLEEGDTGDILVSSGLTLAFNIENPEDVVGQSMALDILPEDAKERTAQNTLSDYRVKGVVEESGNTVFILDSAVPDALKQGPLSEIRIRPESESSMEGIRSELSGEGYSVSAVADIVHQVETFFTIVQFILGFFGIIALFVSAIGMFNTMTVALLEQTQEIGIMKSIGATDRSIAMIFMTEAFFMGLFGGVLGIAVAYIGMFGINASINFLAVRLGGAPVDIFFTPGWFLLAILSFSGFVGILTGVVPAKRASDIDPLSALEYK